MANHSNAVPPLKAVILAGGCRSEFLPLLPGLPKLMFPIGQHPILAYMLEFLRKNGITDVVICLNRQEHVVSSYFDGEEPGMKIRYVSEENPQGTAGCLRDLKHLLGNQPFILLAGAVLMDFDVKAMVDFHQQIGSVMTVGLFKDEECRGFPETIEIWEGKIEGLYSPYHPNDQSRRIRTAGIYLLDPIVFNFIGSESYLDLKSQLVPRIRRAGLPVYPYWINGFCRRIDNPADYSASSGRVFPHEDIPRNDFGNAFFAPINGEMLDDYLSKIGYQMQRRASAFSRYQRKIYPVLKRMLDLTLALTLLLLTCPLWFLIGLAVKLDSPGPIFFQQKRCGKGGTEFTLWKFRSMVANAEDIKPSLAEQNELDGPMFKISYDPRFTRIGGFLQVSGLDELPQLINVLLGHMSMVGPRPSLKDEMWYSPVWRDIRLSVRPGITGLWQARSRTSQAFQDWIVYDTDYVEQRSLSLDFKIMVETVGNLSKMMFRYIVIALKSALKRSQHIASI